MEDARLIFAKRLSAARVAVYPTQETLGLAIGLSSDVARIRINRYERGVNGCNLRTAQKIAEALNMPLAALYADTDEIAEAIIALAKLSVPEQRTAVKALKTQAQKKAKKKRKPAKSQGAEPPH